MPLLPQRESLVDGRRRMTRGQHTQRDDVEGARAAGCHALRFGHDVRDFSDLRARLLSPA